MDILIVDILMVKYIIIIEQFFICDFKQLNTNDVFKLVSDTIYKLFLKH